LSSLPIGEQIYVLGQSEEDISSQPVGEDICLFSQSQTKAIVYSAGQRGDLTSQPIREVFSVNHRRRGLSFQPIREVISIFG